MSTETGYEDNALAMNTTRKSTIVFVVLLLFAGGIGILLIRGGKQSEQPTPVSVTFAGREPGALGRAAGVYLTNSGPASISLGKVRVQVAENSVWKAVSETQVRLSQVRDPGRTKVDFSNVIEAGDYRKIVVERPEDRPGRVEIAYVREAKGIAGIIAKCRIVWRTHKVSLMSRRI